MIDYGHLPYGKPLRIDTYTSPVRITDNDWITWTKPRNAKLVSLFVVGAGSGGGGGASTASGSAGGGGAGGYPGATAKLIVPAVTLPDTLFILIGAGGAGGAAGASGGDAGISMICWYPSVLSPILRSDEINSVKNGGGSGSAAAGGSMGANTGTVTPRRFNHGIFFTVAGLSTDPGGYTSALGSSTLFRTATTITGSSGFIGGGTAGGGKSTSTAFDGGNISSNLIMEMPISGGAAPGGAGSNGIVYSRNPLVVTGGLGGAAHPTSTGGKGGDGILGSGGGGGGAGVTGGAGGKGGDGWVQIITY